MLETVFYNQFKSLLSHCPTTKNNVIWVAYSGGMDSHALLHLMHACQQELELTVNAVHINHQLSKNSDVWVEHCKMVCADLQIELKVITLKDYIVKGESVEARARQARYKAFENILNAKDILLTAHHKDDQAETLLLQLMRGAGLRGLSAMPIIGSLGNGYLLRPLLNIDRHALLDYATQYQSRWIEDESNQNVKFDRNFLRHTIMPLLKKRWSSVSDSISRSAKHCANANTLLEILAQQDYEQITQENTLSIARLKQLDTYRQQNLLRFFILKSNLLLPSEKKILEIQRSVLNAKPDAKPCVQWEGVEVYRHRDALYIQRPVESFDNKVVYFWDGVTPLKLPTQHVLKKELLKDISIPQNTKITVRYRQGGERCIPQGRKHHHRLKKLFQEWNVPHWLRDRIPLIYFDDRLVVVVGYCTCS